MKYLEQIERPSKGTIDFNIRQLFNKDVPNFFAHALKLYTEMGCKMDYKQIWLISSEAAAKIHRVDWKWGQLVCSTTYAADFVLEQKAFQITHR